MNIDNNIRGFMDIEIKRLSKYSWFRIMSRDKSIHIDPGYAGYLKNQVIHQNDLYPSDLVLITHFHKDHLQPEVLSKIRGLETRILAPERCAGRIEGNFDIVNPGDKLKIETFQVRVVDAYNTPQGNSTRKLHHKGDGVGYLLRVDDVTFYHAGGTDIIPNMKELGDVYLAFLPIGGMFTMDLEEAVEAALIIQPRIVIPMHNRDVDPREFKGILESKSDIRVFVLDPDETISF